MILAGGINAKVLYSSNDPTRPLFKTLVIVWLGIYAVASIALTGSIAYGLWRTTEWKGKERKLQRGLLMIAETLLPNTLMYVAPPCALYHSQQRPWIAVCLQIWRDRQLTDRCIIFFIVITSNPDTKYIVLSICSAKVYMLCLLIVCRAKYEVVRSTSQNVSRLGPLGLCWRCRRIADEQETYNAYELKTRSQPEGIRVRTETFRVDSDGDSVSISSSTPLDPRNRASQALVKQQR